MPYYRYRNIRRVLLVPLLVRSGGECSIIVRDSIKRFSVMWVSSCRSIYCFCLPEDGFPREQSLALDTATRQEMCLADWA